MDIIPSLHGRTYFTIFHSPNQDRPADFRAEATLFGISGVDTVDPKNIEAVLGTQFTGIPIFFPEL
jgi:hypothetical protein